MGVFAQLGKTRQKKSRRFSVPPWLEGGSKVGEAHTFVDP